MAAMNKLMHAMREYRRVVLKREQLYGAVVAIELLMVIYLLVWTILDTPSKQHHFELTESQTAGGDYIVQYSYFCDSNSNGWIVGAVAWNFLVIVCAAMFAFITRTFESQFRETQVRVIIPKYPGQSHLLTSPWPFPIADSCFYE